MSQWLFPKYVEALDKASTYLFYPTPKSIGAIIFDIDDTLLIPQTGQPIPETVFFYNLIRSIGFTPVIITARPGFEENVYRTIQDLKSIGVTGFEYIFFMPPGMQDIYSYKLNARKEVYDIYKGNIIMSIGDMEWDIGEYGGYGVVLRKK